MTRLPKLGWIGTGVMGQSMIRRLLVAGYQVEVTTRTKSKAESLLDEGAKWVERPVELADGNDVVISMVGYPRDVEDIYLGDRDGARAGAALPDGERRRAGRVLPQQTRGARPGALHHRRIAPGRRLQNPDGGQVAPGR